MAATTRKSGKSYYFKWISRLLLCCLCFMDKVSVSQGLLKYDSEEFSHGSLDLLDNDVRSYLKGIATSTTMSHTTAIPPYPVENSCKAFIDEYAAVAAGFTKCSIENARPLRFCEKCVKDYALAKSVYKEIMKGLVKYNKELLCGQYLLNADKIQLIGQTETFIERIWSDGHCDNCFEHYSVVNGTLDYTMKGDIKKFQRMANETLSCFLNHSRASIQPFGPTNYTQNNTVCQSCRNLYKGVNSFYVRLEDDYTNSVCMDVVDMMNYTRMLWSGDFLCSRPSGDVALVVILSVVFCSLPVIFYAAAKIYGTKQEHRIIEQNRYRNNQTQDVSGTAQS